MPVTLADAVRVAAALAEPLGDGVALGDDDAVALAVTLGDGLALGDSEAVTLADRDAEVESVVAT